MTTQQTNAERMKARFASSNNANSQNNNVAKEILETALIEKEEEHISQASMKKEINKQENTSVKPIKEKRDIPITFKTTRSRMNRIEKALKALNDSHMENFGTGNMGVSEFVDSMLLTHPKMKQLLGEE
jgi:hypothetical protein